jgi:hypothetical protein
MQDTKRIWVWVGVVVVVIGVVIFVVWKPSGTPATSANPAPVYATQGQLVPQFPKALIIDSNAVVTNSYSIAYTSSTNEYSAEFNSSSSMPTLYNNYLAYLPQNGWTVISATASHPQFRIISAKQGATSAQVIINASGTGSNVSMSYNP